MRCAHPVPPSRVAIRSRWRATELHAVRAVSHGGMSLLLSTLWVEGDQIAPINAALMRMCT